VRQQVIDLGGKKGVAIEEITVKNNVSPLF
jgi:hypothetical protein